VSVGLTLAAHGAQKAFGWWGGPGFNGWRGAVAAMGFRPAGLFATASMLAELLGGVSLALGLFTSVGAALIVAQMTVILFHVHWPRGFWNTERGIEYPLQLAVVAVALGLVGRGLLSIDGALATPGLFVIDGLSGLDRAIILAPPLTLRLALLLGGAVAGSLALLVPNLAGARRDVTATRSQHNSR
jgi:putative oxidoreductase